MHARANRQLSKHEGQIQRKGDSWIQLDYLPGLVALGMDPFPTKVHKKILLAGLRSGFPNGVPVMYLTAICKVLSIQRTVGANMKEMNQ